MTEQNYNSALLIRLRNMRDTVSNAERKVLDYTLQHPEEVIHLSVSGLADASGASEATVVRACRTMGFDGFQDFKVTLAQSIVTPLQSIHEDISPGDTCATIINKIFQSATNTLALTHDATDAKAIHDAAVLILNADIVYIYGLGNSHSIAQDLQHKLMRLGLKAIVHTDSHLQAIASANATSNDVVFAISHSGSSIDVVNAAQSAKANGAKVISITNVGSSPLANISDIKLFTASNETKYRIVALDSRIAQIAIIDSLYTIIATMLPDASNRFYKIEKSLENKKF